MQKIEESPFLTSLNFQQNTKQKYEIEKLKQNMRQLLAKLPDSDILQQVMLNLGIESSLLRVFDQMMKDNCTNSQKLKVAVCHLRIIEKERVRLANTISISKHNNIKTQESNQQIYAPYRNKIIIKTAPYCLPSPLSNQLRVAKCEIERELFQRKCVKQIKQGNRSQMKKQYLFCKSMSARVMNDKVSTVYHNVRQKQKQQNTQILKRRRLLSEQYQKWGNKFNKTKSSSANKIEQKVVIKKVPIKKSFKNIDQFSPSHSFLSDKIQEFGQTEKKMGNKKAEIAKVELKHQKYNKVIQRSEQIRKFSESLSMKKVVKKNQKIQKAINKKQSKTCRSSVNNKLCHESISKRVCKQSSEHLNQYQSLNQEEFEKKSKILSLRCQNLKERSTRSLLKVMHNKAEIKLARQRQIEKQNERQCYFREKLENKKYQENKRIENVIRKQREECENIQSLSQQIPQFKTYTEKQLSKKLEQIRKSMLHKATESANKNQKQY